ncbi:hypothetical protein B0H16DRAFT_1457357 [Mycena metata]|uniref:Glycan binding protein Y3-like domain-containing protein n=1 Tax=Mycena metata TaxID=1033252 RepID=A0AAD7NF40_9AGAR|nr:hypothetical protein B0H16DRAFT_1457357 [Mycena metata]
MAIATTHTSEGTEPSSVTCYAGGFADDCTSAVDKFCDEIQYRGFEPGVVQERCTPSPKGGRCDIKVTSQGSGYFWSSQCKRELHRTDKCSVGGYGQNLNLEEAGISCLVPIDFKVDPNAGTC